MKNSKIIWLSIYSGLVVAFKLFMVFVLALVMPFVWFFGIVIVIAFGDVMWGGDDTELTKALEYDKAVWVSYEDDAWFIASDANEEKYGFRCVGKLKYNEKWYDFIPNVGLHRDIIGGYVFPDGLEAAVSDGGVALSAGIQIYEGSESVDDYEFPTYTLEIDEVKNSRYISEDELWIDFERLDLVSYQGIYETVYSDIRFKLNYDDTFSLYAGDRVREGEVIYEGRYIVLKVSRGEIYVFENNGYALIYSKDDSINDIKLSDGTAFYAETEGGGDYD